MVNESRIIQVNDINIGKNIAKYRKLAGYKQTELVTMLQLSGYDISTFSYNRIEKGTQNPTVSLLLHLCEILSCDMNALFEYIEEWFYLKIINRDFMKVSIILRDY